MIFAARGAAVKHFSVCARYVREISPPTFRKLFIPGKARFALYANPAYEYYSLRASAAIIGIEYWIRVAGITFRVVLSVVRLCEREKGGGGGRTKKKKENKNRKRHKMNSRRINERRYSHLSLGRENSRRNEKFKRVAARLSSRSGGWQISAIPARYQPARFPTIDNLSAREIRRRRREFIVHRRSRGLVKVRLYYARYRESENESILTL